MQSDLIGTNETKKIDSHVFRQPLQFGGSGPIAGKNNVDEHGRIIAPLDADMMVDPLYERIIRIALAQAINSVRDFLAGGPFIENDGMGDFHH